MSLSFSLRSKQSDMVSGLREDHPHVESEEEFCLVLTPCFQKIKLKTKKLIDLYSWVEFKDNELQIVREEFEAERRKIDLLTASIRVELGTEYHPDGAVVPLIHFLVPSDISDLLQKIIKLIDLAKRDNMIFVCKGD